MEIEIMELETIEPINVRTIFECVKCELETEHPDILGCSRCNGTLFRAKSKEVIY